MSRIELHINKDRETHDLKNPSSWAYDQSYTSRGQIPKVMDQSIQMIDACHIVPFSESGDDTISNGISLCPNLHRAFDRGLISINDNYTVIVKHFQEATNLYSIRQFEGRKILLPENKMFYPSIENIRSHRIRFNFQ